MHVRKGMSATSSVNLSNKILDFFLYHVWHVRWIRQFPRPDKYVVIRLIGCLQGRIQTDFWEGEVFQNFQTIVATLKLRNTLLWPIFPQEIPCNQYLKGAAESTKYDKYLRRNTYRTFMRNFYVFYILFLKDYFELKYVVIGIRYLPPSSGTILHLLLSRADVSLPTRCCIGNINCPTFPWYHHSNLLVQLVLLKTRSSAGWVCMFRETLAWL